MFTARPKARFRTSQASATGAVRPRFGSPAVFGWEPGRSVALRPRLSTGLPLTIASQKHGVRSSAQARVALSPLVRGAPTAVIDDSSLPIWVPAMWPQNASVVPFEVPALEPSGCVASDVRAFVRVPARGRHQTLLGLQHMHFFVRVKCLKIAALSPASDKVFLLACRTPQDIQCRSGRSGNTQPPRKVPMRSAPLLLW
jgi:hypothetical protein